MFNTNEKRKISAAIEKVLFEIDHPEMPNENFVFKIHIEGKEPWSWADIVPNWTFDKSTS